MSNVDTLKQGYEAFGRGDLDAAAETLADDVQWENPNAPQLPSPGVTKGKDAVKGVWAETPNYWSSFSPSPDEWIEQGDTVVVLGHLEAEAKETGNQVKLPFVHVWRFEGGKAKRFQNLFDTALAAEALGRL